MVTTITSRVIIQKPKFANTYDKSVETNCLVSATTIVGVSATKI